MRTKLLNLTEPLDLCDESGKLLGVFTPLRELEAAERARPPITDEELASRLNERDYSTDEVLALASSKAASISGFPSK